jgi:hypothetical protein
MRCVTCYMPYPVVLAQQESAHRVTWASEHHLGHKLTLLALMAITLGACAFLTVAVTCC